MGLPMDDESKGADVGPPSPNPVQLSMLSWVGSDAPTPAAACTVAAVRMCRAAEPEGHEATPTSPTTQAHPQQHDNHTWQAS